MSDDMTSPTGNEQTAMPVDGTAATPTGAVVNQEEVRERIVAMLKTCYDPEIPVDIYELGLIYDIDVAATGDVHVRMTLTSPACPVAGTLPPEVEEKVASVDGVTGARVDVVWDPPWDKDRMSEAAQLELGMF